MNTFDHTKYRAAEKIELPRRQWPNRVIKHAPCWASVDLRDGNQALLEPMSVEQKKRLWNLLIKMGFKEIEVGFPAASEADYAFVRWLIEAKQIPHDVHIQVLVQAREELIKKTFNALKGVPRAIVHVYNSTSTVQRERVFHMPKKDITAIATRGAKFVKQEAQKYPETAWRFQYSPESFTSTEIEYAIEICDAVLDVWQPTPENPCIINLPSTVEVNTPNVFADQIEYFATHINRRDSIILSVHTHNDRGCAVASAELAILAGADRVEGTLLGNGERTGNVDITTMAMNLYSQGIDPELDLSNPAEIIQVTTETTQLPVHPRHPWLGELVYTAFSGSHQDAIRKCLQQQQDNEPWQVAYLPIDPRDLGLNYQAVIRVNSQSGKGGIAFVLERDFGLILPRWIQTELATLVQQVSDKQAGEINSQAIYDLFLKHFVCDKIPATLVAHKLHHRNNHSDSIEVKIEVQMKNADTLIQLNGSGQGALSAFINALMNETGQQIRVMDYSEHALEEGTNAAAAAYVLLDIDGQTIAGAAIDNDTVSASLKAVISGINQTAIKALQQVS